MLFLIFLDFHGRVEAFFAERVYRRLLFFEGTLWQKSAIGRKDENGKIDQ